MNAVDVACTDLVQVDRLIEARQRGAAVLVVRIGQLRLIVRKFQLVVQRLLVQLLVQRLFVQLVVQRDQPEQLVIRFRIAELL